MSEAGDDGGGREGFAMASVMAVVEQLLFFPLLGHLLSQEEWAGRQRWHAGSLAVFFFFFTIVISDLG
jgi:hypothetical protein